MERSEYKKQYDEKLPCKYDPSNEGLGCAQPRNCGSCGWNPKVKKHRDELLHMRLTEARCHG